NTDTRSNEDDSPQETQIPAHLKKVPRNKRKSQMNLLPVKIVKKELAESERMCSCGCIKTPMGHEVCRQVIHEPAKLYILEEHLHKYVCKACVEGVVCASGTPKLVAGSMASTSVLAHLVVAKLMDAQPIERIGKQWERQGAHIATST